MDGGAAAPSGAPEDAAAAPASLRSPGVCFSVAPGARLPLAASYPVPARPSAARLPPKSKVECLEGTDL